MQSLTSPDVYVYRVDGIQQTTILTGSVESAQALQYWSSHVSAPSSPSPPSIHTLRFNPGSEAIVAPALLQLRQSISPPPTLLIHDLIEGSGLIRQGALQEVLLVKSLLLSGAFSCIIPSAFTIHVQCIESYELLRQNQVYPECTAGFSLDMLNLLGVRKARELDLSNERYYRSLSASHEALMVNLMDLQASRETTTDEIARASIKIPITAAQGQCHAIAFWFNLQMDQETSLSTGPIYPEEGGGKAGFVSSSSYRQGAILVGGDVITVSIGDVLSVDVICTLSRGVEVVVNK